MEAAELVELEEKLAVSKRRLLEVLQQEREGTRVTRQKDAVGKRRVKRKKKKRRRTRRTRSRWSGFLLCCSS